MMFEHGNGEIKINVMECVMGTLQEFPINFSDENKKTAMPAGVDMFGEDTSEKSTEKERKMFLKFTAKASFASKRARPDTAPMSSVSCTRAKNPGRKDWKKLVRMMKVLHQIVNDKSTSRANDLARMAWKIDASFAAHPDMRSHSGAVMSFKEGKGSPMSASAKQKSKTNGSATAEPVSVDQVLPLAAWTPSFMNAQGHPVDENTVHQDNESVISLETNGKNGSGKVFLRAAPAGTGIIAGGAIRSVCEVLGIQDVVAKSLGSANPHNVLKACVNGLKSQNSPKILSAIRGKKIADIVSKREAN